ncbi:MAG: M50 family metallopeptidase [Byssovorax sp.]
MSWYWYVIGALGLALLMVVHEAGHFLMARAFGMRVTRFSIGIGPTFFKIVPEDGYYWFTTAANKVKVRLFRHIPEKHGPTVFQVAMIPVLAYVQIAGMNPFEEIDPEDRGSYANAGVIGRIFTIFAGPLANYLFASVLFFAAVMYSGREFRSTVIDPLPDLPAAKAGLLKDDKIVEIDHTPIQEFGQLHDVVASHPGQPLTIVVERRGERITFTVTPKNDGGGGKIGVQSIGPSQRVPVSFKEAVAIALKAPVLTVRDMVVGLSLYITGKADTELSGPVGMMKQTAKAAKDGLGDLLGLLGVLSAYLGAFNLIPFPALDGGRLMFLAYEATTRKRANARIEAQIHAIGLLMMLSLVAYVTVFKDIRLFKG